jgi:hypothetical protein
MPQQKLQEEWLFLGILERLEGAIKEQELLRLVNEQAASFLISPFQGNQGVTIMNRLRAKELVMNEPSDRPRNGRYWRITGRGRVVMRAAREQIPAICQNLALFFGLSITKNSIHETPPAIPTPQNSPATGTKKLKLKTVTLRVFEPDSTGREDGQASRPRRPRRPTA